MCLRPIFNVKKVQIDFLLLPAVSFRRKLHSRLELET